MHHGSTVSDLINLCTSLKMIKTRLKMHVLAERRRGNGTSGFLFPQQQRVTSTASTGESKCSNCLTGTARHRAPADLRSGYVGVGRQS